MRTRHGLAIAGLMLASLAANGRAAAQDVLKLAIGQINTWENQGPTLGQDAGIFKKHNLALEAFGTQGTGETMQAVIAGSADIGFAVGTEGVMRAFAKGAPVRVILPAFTGTDDLYWYVRSDSPLKSLKDATEQTTIAYSASGSSVETVVRAFITELGVKGRPTATGSPAATLTAVMSGQIDVGWAAPPFGLKEVGQGKIRILARGSDVPSLRELTVRVTMANADALRTRKDTFLRFVRGYREAIDWMYSDPAAPGMYARKVGTSEELVRGAIRDFFPKQAMQAYEVKGLQAAMANAIRLKYLDAPLSEQQLAELIQIPPR